MLNPVLRPVLEPVLRSPFDARLRGGDAPASTVGGQQIGAPGPDGTLYEGYVLSWGDDFAVLNIVGPGTPKGRWFPTKAYNGGIRGSDTLLGTMYDVDPLHTGHNDSNRGVPVGYDVMSVANSVISLKARSATPEEEAHSSPTGAPGLRTELGSVIMGQGAIAYYPTDSEIILEFRARHSTGNPAGWHPDLWSLTIGAQWNTNEWGFEGMGTGLRSVEVDWTTGTGAGSTHDVGNYNYNGDWHTFTFVLRNGGNTLYYINGVLRATATGRNANSKNALAAPIVTSHIYNGTWGGQSYSKAAWDADGAGASLDVDWIRVWRRPAAAHYKPLVAIPDVTLAFLGSTTVTLPSKATLWGDATVAEELLVVSFEENEPGGHHTQTYRLGVLPSGVSWNGTTRELSVNFSSDTTGKAGRLHVCVYGYKADGSTVEPARFSINRGPRIAVATISASAEIGGSYDLYANCDVGRTTPKTISVSGLPAGATWNASTGLITWDDSLEVGTTSVSITLTNAIGQQVSGSVDFVVGAAPISEFSTGFGTAGNLEDLGWTRLDGIAGGAKAASGVCQAAHANTNGTAYVSPQLVEGDHYVECKFLNNSDSFVCLRHSGNGDFIGFRRVASPANQVQVHKRIGGTLTQIGAFGTTTASDVMRLEDHGTDVVVRKNGDVVSPTSGGTSIGTAPPASKREGLVARTSTASWIDDYKSGVL